MLPYSSCLCWDFGLKAAYASELAVIRAVFNQATLGAYASEPGVITAVFNQATLAEQSNKKAEDLGGILKVH